MTRPDRNTSMNIAPFARNTDPDTSHQAARDAAINATSSRMAVLFCHYQHRKGGLNDFELAEILGRQQTSVGSRRADLMKPSRGHVPEPYVAEMLHPQTGKPLKEESPSGSLCKVWRITAAGIAAVEIMLERDAA